SIVYITLVEAVSDRAKEFDDIALKLDAIHDLPDGAGPIVFVKDFGDTAALMLTVASPRIDPIELDLRARPLQRALAPTRRPASPRGAPSHARRGPRLHPGLPGRLPSRLARRLA